MKPSIRPSIPLPKLRPIVPDHLQKDDHDNLLSTLNDIIRSKQSWTIALNNPSISSRLNPTHIERLILLNVRDSRLVLRFFNFLGLHRSFHHSTKSFCLLIHSLAHSKLYWPASSLLQTLLQINGEPRSIFRELFDSYRRFDFYSVYGFDLLVQSYLQGRRVSDSVLIVRLMKECDLLPEVRTLSAVLNGLIKMRQFEMAVGLFDEFFCGSSA